MRMHIYVYELIYIYIYIYTYIYIYVYISIERDTYYPSIYTGRETLHLILTINKHSNSNHFNNLDFRNTQTHIDGLSAAHVAMSSHSYRYT